VALYRGELDRAEALFRQTLTVSEDGGFWGYTVYAWNGLGWVAAERGEMVIAARWHRRTRRAARRHGACDLQALAAIGVARAHVHGRDIRASPRTITAVALQACATATRHGLGRGVTHAALLKAELYHRVRALVPAQTAAEEALQLAMDQQRRREEALAQHLLGQCALAKGLPVRAQSHLRTALSIQREVGAQLDAARTCLTLAEALEAGAENRGSQAETRALLTTAQAQFSASGAALDLARAEELAATWVMR
jgi:hypothetical protein